MRVLYVLIAIALLAVPALAANTGDWRVECNGCVSQGTVSNGLEVGQCRYFDFDDDADPESKFLPVYDMFVSISFDGDTSVADGLGTGKGKLFYCQSPDVDRNGTDDTTSCREAKILDSDLDGFADTGVFNDTNDATKGISVIHLAGYIYVDPTADPGTGNARFVVCGTATAGN